jgi:hypothetical protein
MNDRVSETTMTGAHVYVRTYDGARQCQEHSILLV